MLALARRIRQLDRQVTLFFLVQGCDGDLVLAAMRAGINDILTGSSTADGRGGRAGAGASAMSRRPGRRRS